MKDSYIKISFVGDMMCLQEQNNAVHAKYGEYNYDDTLCQLKPLFEESDYVVANLETPISDFPLSDEPVCFNTPFSFLEAIKKIGVDFLQTANNHCLDRGVDGLRQTLDNVQALGFDHSGTYRTLEESNELFVKELGGLKFAFICCTYGTNSDHNGILLSGEETWRVDLLKKQNKKSRVVWHPEDGPIISKMVSDNVSIAAIANNANEKYTERIKRKILKAREVADVVIVLPHIGGQYNPSPGAYTLHTIDWMTNLHCDLVVAGHPHVPLKSAKVNNVFCAFSLGNCCFTPGVGYYLPNVQSEYGIVLHTYWNRESKHLEKVSFSIIKNVVDDEGIAITVPLYDYFVCQTSASDKECLIIENECIVNKFVGGNNRVNIEKEYWIHNL